MSNNVVIFILDTFALRCENLSLPLLAEGILIGYSRYCSAGPTNPAKDCFCLH